jgi:hypothetical protein
MIFRYLLIFFLIYIALRLFRQVLFGPRVYHRSTGQNYNDPGRNRGREGDVHIQHDPAKKKKKFRKDDGDYVKFEEVDDE